MLSSEDAKSLMGSFPETEFAFGYGSGAIEQGGYVYDTSLPEHLQPMLDFIFVVQNPEQWHTENMQRNPSHYTTLFPLSSSMISYIQEKTGAGVWYNTLIEMKGTSVPKRLMKYGVISSSHLLADLLDWQYLYVSGRLQKPVRVLKENPLIEKAIEMNRLYALVAALYLQKEKNGSFNESDLFMAIAGISYSGDPRMAVGGESPIKIRNLVLPIIDTYKKIYTKHMGHLSGLGLFEQSPITPQPLLQESRGDIILPNGNRKDSFQLLLDNGKNARLSLCSLLPPSIQVTMAKLSPENTSSHVISNSSSRQDYNMKGVVYEFKKANSSSNNSCISVEPVLSIPKMYTSSSPNVYWTKPPSRSILRKALNDVVASAATTQSAKAIVSVGLSKCATYVAAKANKSLSARGFHWFR
jgi:hypothetical protein